MNISGIFTMIVARSDDPIMWKSADEIKCVEWTQEAFLQLCNDSRRHVTDNRLKCEDLILQVVACESKDDVLAVRW